MRQFIKRLDPALVILDQEEPAAHREKFAVLFQRAACHANALWQADHQRHQGKELVARQSAHAIKPDC